MKRQTILSGEHVPLVPQVPQWHDAPVIFNNFTTKDNRTDIRYETPGEKMADVQFVLCDVLCFLVNKFSKTSVKLLKSALGDFYSTEKLSTATLQLISDVDKLNLPVKRPHIPHRRDGAARHANEVEDIVTLFTFLDEQKAYDNLPTYVSDNPDNMPSLRVYEGDLLMLSET